MKIESQVCSLGCLDAFPSLHIPNIANGNIRHAIKATNRSGCYRRKFGFEISKQTHFALSQFSAWVFNSAIALQGRRISMKQIHARIAPLKVFCSIIVFVSVFVVNVSKTFCGVQEVGCDKSVNPKTGLLIVPSQADMQIFAFPKLHNSLAWITNLWQAFYSPVVTYLIKPFVILNRNPIFHESSLFGLFYQASVDVATVIKNNIIPLEEVNNRLRGAA